MSPIKKLMSKLDSICYKALEKAASLSVSRTHYYIELEHFLLGLLEEEKSLFVQTLTQLDVNIEQFKHELNQSLEQLKRGNEKSPAISDILIDLIREAWTMSTLEENNNLIDSGTLLCVLLEKRTFNQLCNSISRQFQQLRADQAHAIIKQLREIQTNEETTEEQTSTDDIKTIKKTKTPSLDQYTINLNAQAKLGKLDAAVGREHEIYQITDILSRRRQNNVILTGEPGVGKTALVEGLALRIVQGDVAENLKNTVIHTLDLALLQAGAGVKGEFENRLKTLIDEIKRLSYPIILFIDEAHTLIGAGATAGQGDAANILKPALARGELRSIAATTWSEYKQYFEKDAALTRRFQIVKVEEPDIATAIQMLRSMASSLETHHKVKVLDDAISSATILSDRYITGRHLPDKSISVLDTACARVSSKLTAKPATIVYLEKQLQHNEQELAYLKNETQWIATADQQRLETLKKTISTQQKQLKKIMTQWQDEQKLCQDIIASVENLSDEKQKLTVAKRKALKNKLEQTQKKLVQKQNGKTLVQPFVDSEAIAEVIADWTGIPLKRMMKDDITQLIYLEDHLQKRVVGQDHALIRIADNIKSSQVKLSDPNKPLGVFLFVGPSGVGKTETARALAEQLYGSEKKMTTINMSEFKEAHKVSMLAGSPPGYVGYGEGGVLTEAVRRKPYSLILLDEMEKAHPSVQEVFYQVFDAGEMKDGQGRDINFKNTLIIMTSNACSEHIEKLCAQSKKPLTAEEIAMASYDQLSRVFKPAFLGRVTVIPYLPLAMSAMKKICRLKLKALAERVHQEHQIEVSFASNVLTTIIAQCQQHQLGARQIEEIIAGQLQPALADQILKSLFDQQLLSRITVSLDKNGTWSFKLTQKDQPKKTVKKKKSSSTSKK